MVEILRWDVPLSVAVPLCRSVCAETDVLPCVEDVAVAAVARAVESGVKTC